LRNGGAWSEGRFQSFIKGALRSASNRWGPKFAAKKAAWVRRGIYLCAGYKCPPHEVPASFVNEKGKRENNIFCDHIDPVIDPVTGFVSWDSVIERLFVEKEGLQLLCASCHQTKTADERQVRKDSKTND
jgi:hypothetical protein